MSALSTHFSRSAFAFYAGPCRLDSGRPWRTSDKPESQTARDQNIEDYASYVLKRRRRKFKRHGRHLERLSPEERHRIRIEAKKLRYAAEFFSELFPVENTQPIQEFIAALGNLQARLATSMTFRRAENRAELVSHKSISARRSPLGTPRLGVRQSG